MKATLIITAIFSLFLTSCVSSLATANNNSAEAEVTYQKTANPTVEKEELELAEVPTIVLAALKKAYPNQMIRETYRIELQDMIYYQFDLQDKRRKTVSVVFNSNAIEERDVAKLR